MNPTFIASHVLPILTDAAAKSAAVLLLAGAVTLTMRRASAAGRHLVWLAAIAMTLLLPIASALLPAYRLAVLPAERVEPITRRITALPTAATQSPSPQTVGPTFGDIPIIPRPQPQLLPLVGPTIPTRVMPVPHVLAIAPARSPLPVTLIVFTIWSTGVVTLLLGWLLGLLAANRLTHRCTRVTAGRVFDAMQSARRELRIGRRVKLHTGDTITMPLASGVLSPGVLLPSAAETWPAAQLRSVLLHELAHVKRHDCAAQSLAQLAVAVYWFNPLVWLAARRLRVERERACDDRVLSHGASPATYAEHLVTVAALLNRRSRPPLAVIAMARPSGLRQRVVDILNGRANRRSLSTRITLATAVVAAAVLIPLSSIHLIAQQVPATRPAAAAERVPAAAAPLNSKNVTQSNTLDLLVLDPAGHPEAHVDADVNRNGEGTTEKTDDAGHVRVKLSTPPPDYLSISVHSAGYAAKLLEWGGENKGTIPPAYTLHLAAGVKIGGRVVDETGKPVSGAHVELWMGKQIPDSHERYWNDTSLVTAADGSWSYADAPPVADAVRVGVWDYRYANDGTYPIDTYPDDQLRGQGITLTLHPGVAVHGIVLGPDGKPLAGAHVLGGGQLCSNRVPAQTTAADGRFTYVTAKSSLLVLTVRAKDCAPELRQITVDQSPQDVSIPLVHSKAMVGVVVDPQGKPIPHAWVYPDTWRGNRSLDIQLQADARGKFTWAEAPADTVYCDVAAEGFLRQQTVAMTASDKPVTVTLQPAVKVSGTVVDAGTGKPVDVFRVIPGIDFGGGQATYFERTRSAMKPRGGRFEYTEDWSRPGYAVRIEADGYLPAESRRFTGSERNVSLQFRLERGSGPTITVLKADGRPAAGATGVLALPGSWMFIRNGLEPENRDAPQATADAAGRLTFPPQTTNYGVVVLGPDGWAQATRDELAKAGGRLTLSPWAHVQGTLMIGNHPAADEKVAALPREGAIDSDSNAIHIGHQIETTTDASGHFSFDRIPPGPLTVARQVMRAMGGGSFTNANTDVEMVNASPGQSLTVNLGGHGRRVTGRLVLPPELLSRADWNYGFACLATAPVVFPTAPKPPADLAGTGADKQRAWQAAFMQSAAGKTYLAAVAAAQDRSARSTYPLEIDHDNNFRIEDVAAGTYTLSVDIGQKNSASVCGPGDDIATASASFTVPPMPSGRDDQPLQLPPVVVHMLPTANVGDAAPDSDLKSLDGHDVKLSSFHGKFVLLDFWATWCGPCVAETPSLKAAFDGAKKDDRFAMISLSLDEKAGDAQAYVAQNHLDWTQAFLPGAWDSPTVQAYGVRSIPSIWLIGPDGKVIGKNLRGDAIAAAVTQALSTPRAETPKAQASTPEPGIALASAPPVVVRTMPPAGAADVDPAVRELRVTFSKPMTDQSWSWVQTGASSFPEITGRPHYSADHRTCTLPVKLKPNHAYTIWLNADAFQNFTDEAHQTAVPYLLVFHTRAAAATQPSHS